MSATLKITIEKASGKQENSIRTLRSMLEAQAVLRNLRRVKTMVNSERAVTAILETKPEELSAVAVIIDHEKVNNHRRNVYTLKELSGGRI